MYETDFILHINKKQETIVGLNSLFKNHQRSEPSQLKSLKAS